MTTNYYKVVLCQLIEGYYHAAKYTLRALPTKWKIFFFFLKIRGVIRGKRWRLAWGHIQGKTFWNHWDRKQ
jgi:hypothetical protein